MVRSVSAQLCDLMLFQPSHNNSSLRRPVFHQADGAGNPVMDLGHVTEALNKLDTQDEEKIVLSSRDGKSLMVVSYADVARCLDSAYNELCQGSVRASSLLY